ncbi:helix-turn-helix domain-containing protein [Streptomyces sp. NPDC018972]|uniref:helix-turn-helix domain-containing protein n=1 Tax=Streptomyces sp. NPDC018972 TaxID=3365060 RepID=UPI0037BD0E18
MPQTDRAFPGPPTKPPQPAQADTPAEFNAALRTLRTWSGLTYRQLESKAAAHGHTLPASTVATTLGRATLPRERFVNAFTHACGLGEEEIQQWLKACRRIAADGPVLTRGEDGDDRDAAASGTSAPAHNLRWWRRVVALVGAASMGAISALGVVSLVRDTSPPAELPTMPVTDLRMLAVGSWARIHPARTPKLCVTEGRDRTGRYKTAVAVQRPCTQTNLPRVFLEPVGRDVVQIQWHHPKYEIGCLTLLLKGSGQDLLEPRDDCADTNRAQQFRLERFGPSTMTHFRIRPVSTGLCLSLRDQDTAIGAEVVQGRCSGAADQDFLIELIRPPLTAAAPLNDRYASTHPAENQTTARDTGHHHLAGHRPPWQSSKPKSPPEAATPTARSRR